MSALSRQELEAATRAIHRAAARQPRPVIHQRPLDPVVRDGREVVGHSTTVMYPPATLITWQEARRRARALERVYDGLPAWPKKADLEKLEEIRAKAHQQRTTYLKVKKEGKLPKRYKRDPRGEWWMAKFADVVDARKDKATPAYSPRQGRKIKARQVKVAP